MPDLPSSPTSSNNIFQIRSSTTVVEMFQGLEVEGMINIPLAAMVIGKTLAGQE